MKEKNPFEPLLSQMTEMMDHLVEKGYKPMEEGIPKELLDQLAILEQQMTQLRAFSDEMIDTTGADSASLEPTKAMMAEMKPREKKFFEQLDQLKKELLFRKRTLERGIKEGKPEKKAPTSEKEKAKRERRAMKRKFRGIGSDQKWKKL